MDRFGQPTQKSADTSDRDPTFRALLRDESRHPRVGELPAVAQRRRSLSCSTFDTSFSLENETKAEHHHEQDGKDTLRLQPKQKKRVRYLCDTDRYNIILRIEKGEKQANLAREYGVTRAAICQIKKNRHEIKSRYDLLIEQTQASQRVEQEVTRCTPSQRVREIQSNSVTLLLTTLRDRQSDPTTFRRATERLIRCVDAGYLFVHCNEKVTVAIDFCLKKHSLCCV